MSDTSRDMRSVLFLSYLFPPRGGAGVQRSLKFVKYLPQNGWRPLVVTNGADVDDRNTAVRDSSLLRDLPPGTVVRETELTEAERRRMRRSQSRLWRRLQPTDPSGWWVHPAIREGMDLVRKFEPQVIFVTMSPFTSAAAGIELKRRTGLPLVLDLRDPWAMDETRIYPSRWHAARDWSAMARAMAAADLVIMNVPECARAGLESFKLAPGARMISLTNGYDAEDFHVEPTEPAPRDVLRIVHTGMFHSELAELWEDLYARRGLVNRIKYPRRRINLWTRTPKYLLAAMEKAVAEGRIPADKLQLVLVGEVTDADRRLVNASPLAGRVEFLGYRSHVESVRWVLSADVLFLPLHMPLDGGPAPQAPGKAYEYLGSGRPILAMGPPGDMLDFVREAKAGAALAGDDVAGAADFLAQAWRAKCEGRKLVEPDMQYISRFERRELTRQLAGELDRLVQSVPAMSGN